MATTYLTGEQTKQRIIDETRILFYKNGYTQTTYTDISTAAGINRALIPYHFQNKQVLGKTIFQNVLNELTNTLDTLLDISQFSADFASVLHMMTFCQLLNNTNFVRFVSELQSDNNTCLFNEEQEQQQILSLGSKFSQLPATELVTLTRLYIGMKKEMLQLVSDSKIGVNTTDIITMQIEMLMGYAGYSKKKTDELVNAVAEVLQLFHFQIAEDFSVTISYN